MRRRRAVLLVFGFALLLSSACSHAARSGGADAYDFTDDYGRTVAVPSRPLRIVSASPAVTEIVFAIGADSLLVGRTDFCRYPPDAARIESIGGISNLNVEKIVSLRPDLVVSGSMIPEKNTLQLQNLGVPTVCVTEKDDFDGLYANIAAIGLLTGHAAAADSLCRIIRTRVEALPVSHGSRPTVYYVVGFGSGGNYTAGGNSFINSIISMAGGRNIAETVSGWSFSLEALMQADPDYVVIRREDSARFCSTQPYSRLTAVREGRVIAIESGIVDLQVPRNVEAVEALAARLGSSSH